MSACTLVAVPTAAAPVQLVPVNNDRFIGIGRRVLAGTTSILHFALSFCIHAVVRSCMLAFVQLSGVPQVEVAGQKRGTPVASHHTAASSRSHQSPNIHPKPPTTSQPHHHQHHQHLQHLQHPPTPTPNANQHPADHHPTHNAKTQDADPHEPRQSGDAGAHDGGDARPAG